MPGAMAPWSDPGTGPDYVLETEQVRFRRRTGFWAMGQVIKGERSVDVTEERFYEWAHRPELCVVPHRILRFERMKDSTEMFEA
jgi:hypothetical protein